MESFRGETLKKMAVTPLLIFGGLLSIILVCVLTIIIVLSYNIPVTILRFTGNKERPLLFHRKAKKFFRSGVPMLKVRGYKGVIRDYLSENYYPTPKGKYGALLLWEFEDGLLTPAIPAKVYKNLSKEEQAELEITMKQLQDMGVVKFNFDEQMYHKLMLKVVDDVDVEFNIEQNVRIDGQYTGGFRDFLNKYTGHIVVVIMGFILLTGLIVFLDKMPELAAQCYGAADAAVRSSLLERAAENIKPLG